MAINVTEFWLKTHFLLRETKLDNVSSGSNTTDLNNKQEDVSRLTSCVYALPLCMHVHVAPALADPVGLEDDGVLL